MKIDSVVLQGVARYVRGRTTVDYLIPLFVRRETQLWK
jgi:hypothetical protein